MTEVEQPYRYSFIGLMENGLIQSLIKVYLV